MVVLPRQRHGAQLVQLLFDQPDALLCVVVVRTEIDGLGLGLSQMKRSRQCCKLLQNNSIAKRPRWANAVRPYMVCADIYNKRRLKNRLLFILLFLYRRLYYQFLPALHFRQVRQARTNWYRRFRLYRGYLYHYPCWLTYCRLLFCFSLS